MPVSSRRIPWTGFVCVAVLLLGLAGSLYKIHFPPGPVADEAAYVMIAQSLWHDHDLRYEPRDLERAFRLWDQGPHGLILFTDDGGQTMYYGKPYVYSLAALPFYAVFGAQGMMLFNMALYLAMLGAALWFFGPGLRRPALLLGGFFFASVTFVYVFWIQPEVFDMTVVFFALLAWQVVRRREGWSWREPLALALAGGLLAAGFASREPLAVFALPIGVDLLWQRRWKGLAAFVVPALVAAALLVGVQWKLTGHPSPYRDVQRRSFDATFPLEPGAPDLWELYRGTSFGSWSGLAIETNPRVLARDVEYFFLGRHVGLLAYFPFALFVLGLYLVGPWDRSRHLLLVAVVAYCAALFVMRPHNFQGGAGFLGNRYFATVYPALLFLPGRLRGGRSLVLPYLAAGLWTAAVVAVPVQQVAPEFGLQVHTRMPTFQALPLELTLLAQGRIPGFYQRGWPPGVWIVPKDDFSAQENHPRGVWVRGDSRSEVVIVTPRPVDSVRFTAFSPLPDQLLEVASNAGRQVAAFATHAARRDGVTVEVPVHPVARNLGFLGPGVPEWFYELEVSTRTGWVPLRTDPESQDPRYLGVFLSFTGEGP